MEAAAIIEEKPVRPSVAKKKKGGCDYPIKPSLVNKGVLSRLKKMYQQMAPYEELKEFQAAVHEINQITILKVVIEKNNRAGNDPITLYHPWFMERRPGIEEQIKCYVCGYTSTATNFELLIHYYCLHSHIIPLSFQIVTDQNKNKVLFIRLVAYETSQSRLITHFPWKADYTYTEKGDIGHALYQLLKAIDKNLANKLFFPKRVDQTVVVILDDPSPPPPVMEIEEDDHNHHVNGVSHSLNGVGKKNGVNGLSTKPLPMPRVLRMNISTGGPDDENNANHPLVKRARREDIKRQLLRRELFHSQGSMRSIEDESLFDESETEHGDDIEDAEDDRRFAEETSLAKQEIEFFKIFNRFSKNYFKVVENRVDKNGQRMMMKFVDEFKGRIDGDDYFHGMFIALLFTHCDCGFLSTPEIKTVLYYLKNGTCE